MADLPHWGRLPCCRPVQKRGTGCKINRQTVGNVEVNVLNLRLYDRTDDREVTAEYLPTKEDYVRLFVYLNDRKEINQDTLLKDYFRLKKVKCGNEKEFAIRWNYIEDKEKKYPCNETRHELLAALDRAGMEHGWLDDSDTSARW